MKWLQVGYCLLYFDCFQMEYKKKINLQDQKSIGVKVQRRKRKYEEDKKNPANNKAV